MHVTWPVEITPESPFPVTNIPFGIFNEQGLNSKRVGVAIGEYILDVACLESHGLFEDIWHLQDEKPSNGWDHSPRPKGSIFAQSSLNDFATLSSAIRTAVRRRIIMLLQNKHSALFSNPALNCKAFHKQSEAKMHLPMQIGDFTDFMCSRTHVDNCSRLAGNPKGAPPNFYAHPSAYNGRSSSIIVSRESIFRPYGIIQAPPSSSSQFEFVPSQQMDFELELGFFVAKPIKFGQRIGSPDEAKDHIFGFVLLNDWSARDIQFTEMTPLGPFNGKGSATTISPWVVTLDALEGSEVVIGDGLARERIGSLPKHLRHGSEDQTWSISVEASLGRAGYTNAVSISKSNLSDLYWSPAQMLVHHASSGCGMRTGDLLGTGTISSPEKELAGASSMGCLYEMTAAGTKPFLMSNGDTVTWLKDGDEVVLTGKVVRQDETAIGFGECRGVLKSALPNS